MLNEVEIKSPLDESQTFFSKLHGEVQALRNDCVALRRETVAAAVTAAERFNAICFFFSPLFGSLLASLL